MKPKSLGTFSNECSSGLADVRARVGQYPYSLANVQTHWQMFETHFKISKRIGFRATKVFDHLSNSSDDIHWRSFLLLKNGLEE